MIPDRLLRPLLLGATKHPTSILSPNLPPKKQKTSGLPPQQKPKYVQTFTPLPAIQITFGYYLNAVLTYVYAHASVILFVCAKIHHQTPNKHNVNTFTPDGQQHLLQVMDISAATCRR